ncbi:MAG: MFS transporter [Planctomycetota bacterium]
MQSPSTTVPPMPPLLNSRLSVMMFLQYAIWGAWLPFLWSYLYDYREMQESQIGWIFAAGAVGAIFGPFIAGQIADRYFATEKFLGLSHLAGAALIWQLPNIASFSGFFLFSALYGMLYAPTMSLTNSLAFHHIPDRDRDFGRVRLWGTVGWIVVGLSMGHWLAFRHTPEGLQPNALLTALAAGKADAFRLSALLGVAMGVYCFTLPHTPPDRGAQSNAALSALKAVRINPLLTLFALAIPVSIIHQFYFVHAEAFLSAKQLESPAWMKAVFGAGGGGLMTIGQMSEVVVLALIPLLILRFSRKTMLAIGLAAYALRMALFAYVDVIPLPTMVTLVLGIALHGIIFGCFIFLAFIIVDEETRPDVRASAQNLFNLVIVGCGVIVGSMVATSVAKWAGQGDSSDYFTKLFAVPMYASLVCLVLLLALYPRRRAAL